MQKGTTPELTGMRGIEMKVTKEEFEAVYWIEYMGYNTPKLLSEIMNITEEEAERILNKLKERGLITIEIRENQFYGSKLTKEGKEIWNDEQYNKWKKDLGY
jgi:DNA-binding transcriptional regulator LsrR (DeoR family)